MKVGVIGHGERAHALLSASGASRWLACPPSARLEEENKRPEKPSIYAEEGTAAHELAELLLRYDSTFDRGTLAEIEKFKAENKFYSEAMQEEVEKYVDFVTESYVDACNETSDAKLLLEEKIDLTSFIEEGFGTGDAVIISDRVLRVIDLKYGKGIRVSADNNSQLKLYGLGALIKFSMLYDIEEVSLTVHQPRLDAVSTWSISAEELLHWGENHVKPTAALAFAGGGQTIAGDHCTFCKVNAMCKTYADLNLEVAKYEFQSPSLLEDSQILDIYERLPMLLKWAESIKSHVFGEALNGKKWEGYKLVEGRSNRQISDEEALILRLKGEGYADDDIFNKKIKGITDLTKLLGAKSFKSIVEPVLIKPQGAPTLTDDQDKRPAIGLEQAKLDFK
jgi:hypothetical protein